MSKKSKKERKLKKTSERNSQKLKTTPIEEGKIHFRFDYFDATHTFFDGSAADFDWARNMLKRLKTLQDTTVDYFKTDMVFRKTQYVHPINWDKAELNSFDIQQASPDLDEDAWQFGISKGKGRVHGFFIGDFFHVVWIDPEHRLNKYWTPN